MRHKLHNVFVSADENRLSMRTSHDPQKLAIQLLEHAIDYEQREKYSFLKDVAIEKISIDAKIIDENMNDRRLQVVYSCALYVGFDAFNRFYSKVYPSCHMVVAPATTNFTNIVSFNLEDIEKQVLPNIRKGIFPSNDAASIKAMIKLRTPRKEDFKVAEKKEQLKQQKKQCVVM